MDTQQAYQHRHAGLLENMGHPDNMIWASTPEEPDGEWLRPAYADCDCDNCHGWVDYVYETDPEEPGEWFICQECAERLCPVTTPET